MSGRRAPAWKPSAAQGGDGGWGLGAESGALRRNAGSQLWGREPRKLQERTGGRACGLGSSRHPGTALRTGENRLPAGRAGHHPTRL